MMKLKVSTNKEITSAEFNKLNAQVSFPNHILLGMVMHPIVISLQMQSISIFVDQDGNQTPIQVQDFIPY